MPVYEIKLQVGQSSIIFRDPRRLNRHLHRIFLKSGATSKQILKSHIRETTRDNFERLYEKRYGLYAGSLTGFLTIFGSRRELVRQLQRFEVVQALLHPQVKVQAKITIGARVNFCRLITPVASIEIGPAYDIRGFLGQQG